MAKSSSQPEIAVSELKVGQIIKLPLSWTNHPFLRNRVILKSEVEIEMIKGLGVPYVILLDDVNSAAENEQISEQQSTETTQDEPLPEDESKLLRKSLSVSQKRFYKSISDTKAVHSKIVTDPDGAYRLSASTVEALLADMLEVDKPYLTLVEGNDTSVSINQHCVSVAVVSMLMARLLKVDQDLIRDIALGSLLHDYGKFKVPDSILRKKDELTVSERNFYNLHPNYGVNVLKDQEYISKVALHIIGHHHEYLDGSGYPDKLKEKQIPLSTQIVSLVNQFDNLLSDVRFPTPQIALGHLFKNGAKKHSPNLISALVKIMGIYPPGTLVKLSDNSVGKVMITNEQVKKPSVLCCKVDGSDASLKTLSKEDIEIVKVITVDDLSSEAKTSIKATSPISFYFTAATS
ncbi:phosphohydrolase [Shewanella sp. OPT22]|nr:phosphohydrolase [Shewanella sp. OPT22]